MTRLIIAGLILTAGLLPSMGVAAQEGEDSGVVRSPADAGVAQVGRPTSPIQRVPPAKIEVAQAVESADAGPLDGGEDAGPEDGGTPAAVEIVLGKDAPSLAPPVTEPATDPFPFWGDFNFFQPPDTVRQVPINPEPSSPSWEGLLPELPRRDDGSWLGSVFWISVFVLLFVVSIRVRRRVAAQGIVPVVLRFSTWCLGLGIVLMGIELLPRLVSDQYAPALRWTIVAVAVAAGWTTRDLLPDVFAWIVLRLEGRIDIGSWISADETEGSVETASPRAVWIRDRRGRRVAIPNRKLLRVPVATSIGGVPVHDAILRLPEAPAIKVRHALEDAVLISPWVRVGSKAIVSRDGHDPNVWRVRAELIDIHYAVLFESQLTERVEELLQ